MTRFHRCAPPVPLADATLMPAIAEVPASEQLSRWPVTVRALRHRNYRLFFCGQLISLSGTWMQQVAQGWLVLRLTGSPLLLSLVAAAASLPVLLLSIPAGALVDRVSRHRLLVMTQVIAMLLALVLAFLTFTNTVREWHILVLAMLLGIVNAFDAPARQAFTVEMVGHTDLLNAIALNSSIFNAARTIGPALAGIGVAAIGEGPAFLLNGLSYLAVIASLLMMRLPPFRPPPRQNRMEQLHEGMRYIVQEPIIRTLLLLAGVISLFGFVYVPLLPIFARDVLHAGAQGLGWLAAAGGGGALVAALLLARAGDQLPRMRMVLIASLLYPVFLIGFTMMTTLLSAMLLLALTGWAAVTTMSLINTLIQSVVPDALRGRVMSVFTLLLLGLSPLGGLAAGAIAEVVGNVPLVVALSGIITAGMTIGILVRSPQVLAETSRSRPGR